MTLHKVTQKEYEVNTRVQPIGSEYYENTYFIGAFGTREMAFKAINREVVEYSKSMLDEFLDALPIDGSIEFGRIERISDNKVVFYTTDSKQLEDRIIFEIEEVEIYKDL